MAHRDALIEAIATNGKIDTADATKVFDLYVAEKIIRFGAHSGFSVTHGAFLDADVIKDALAIS